MEIIAKRLLELRCEYNLTQTQLAKNLGVSQDTISLWERNRSNPDAEMLIKLAKFYNTSSDYILGLED